jgi:hypothetical protein
VTLCNPALHSNHSMNDANSRYSPESAVIPLKILKLLQNFTADGTAQPAADAACRGAHCCVRTNCHKKTLGKLHLLMSLVQRVKLCDYNRFRLCISSICARCLDQTPLAPAIVRLTQPINRLTGTSWNLRLMQLCDACCNGSSSCDSDSSSSFSFIFELNPN